MTDGTWTHAWDFKNRLITSTSTGNTVSYLYDYSGNRIKKTDTTSGTPTYYLDAGYEVEGTKTRHHVSAPGIGSIATVTIDSGSTETIYHLTDHLGGAHIEVDDSGVVQEWKVYEPFGEVRHSYQAGTYNNSKTFTGKELDNETNLQYFGARYYDNVQGRFVSADPLFLGLGSVSHEQQLLRDPQRWNSYAYGRNNPYKMVDPDGRSFLNRVANFAAGAINAWTSNNMMGYGRVDINNSAYQAGQAVGDGLSFVQGIAEAAAGAIAVAVGSGGGAVTTPTVVGPIAGAAVVTAGTAITAHGAGVGITAANNLVESAMDGSGGGGNASALRAGDKINNVEISSHAAKRATERGVSAKQIENALNSGTRYYDMKKDTIVSVIGEKGQGGYSIVTSTDMQRVVTVSDYIPNLNSQNGTRYMQIAQ